MGKFMAKIQNFDSFGGCIPIFLPQRKFWHVTNFTFIGERVALRGKKPNFGPLSKNNTAWLHFAQACR